MPINKITSSKRGISAIAATVLFAGVSGWSTFTKTETAPVTPAEIRAAIAKGYTPPTVKFTIDKLIKPWEGLVLKSHWDQFSKRYDICYGDTLIDGKPVQPGMSFTPEQCDKILTKRVINDYYLPLVDGAKGYTKAPYSLQMSLLSGGYNFGVGAQLKPSTAVRLMSEGVSLTTSADVMATNADKEKDPKTATSMRSIAKTFRAQAVKKYRESCEAQTAFNKSSGQVLKGLVKRREMGDAQRIGEAELCVSGL